MSRPPRPLLRALLLALAFAAVAFAPSRAAAARLTSFTWSTGENSLTFNLEFDRPVRPAQIVNNLAENHFFYLEFFNIDAPASNREWNVDSPLVFHVKQLYYDPPGALQLAFYARSDVRYTLVGAGTSSLSVIIQPVNYRALGAGGNVGARKLVVIDPGHGGKTTDERFHLGARTSQHVNGRHIFEKELTLALARELEKLIAQAPNLDSYITRTDDTYVSLTERIRLADRAQGDLFVSIHLNAQSSSRKTARGFEIYFLSDGSRQVNRYLLSLENEMGVDLDDPSSGDEMIGDILRSLVDDKLNERRAESREAAIMIADEFRRFGPFRGHYRGVKSMPFRVLINYNMPAVLVELGFLDHPADAALVVQPAVQRQIAALLFNGINRYFAMEDPDFVPRLAAR